MWLYAAFVGAVPVGSPPERFHHIPFEYNGRLLRTTSTYRVSGIYRIRGGRPTWRPYEGPGRGVFHEPRVTRDDVVILSLLPRSGI